jgi:hypothetical protein
MPVPVATGAGERPMKIITSLVACILSIAPAYADEFPKFQDSGKRAQKFRYVGPPLK